MNFFFLILILVLFILNITSHTARFDAYIQIELNSMNKKFFETRKFSSIKLVPTIIVFPIISQIMNKSHFRIILPSHQS